MTWLLFRWVWQLEGSLHVGLPPAGSLNRTRLYAPARAIWGAVTAELSRSEAVTAEPEYQAVGASLQDGYRFTYLFPAEVSGSIWAAWLPTYRDGVGLGWHREDSPESLVGDRAFRRRLLSTRPATAIDANTAAADDGSLRETECIEAHWRDQKSRSQVALVGYVFVRVAKAKNKYATERRRLDAIDTLFVGGDTRYGLGRVRRIAFERAQDVFGANVTLSGDAPLVTTERVLGHAIPDKNEYMRGALELLQGWDRLDRKPFGGDAPLWQPGSCMRTETSATAPVRSWTVEGTGLWRAEK